MLFAFAVVAAVGMFGSVAVSSAEVRLGSTQQIRNGTLVVGFDSSRRRPGPTSVSWRNRTLLQTEGLDGGALTMSWSLRGALFGGAKSTASSQSNQTDGTAEVVSAGATSDGGWLETLRYNAVGVTVARTWRIDAARQEVVCSVQVVATSPANPLGNPTLLEAWIQANLHDVPDVAGMTARYFSPHPQAQFDIDCCPGCVFEGGAHVAGQPAGLISNVYAPLHTAAAGVYDRVHNWGAATWLSGVGGGYNTWTIASEGNFDIAAASATYNPRVCAGQWRHFLFRGFTADADAMHRGFEFRLTLFDGEPMSFLSAAADLPARQVLVKKRVHPDLSSTLPDANALVMFPYYAPGATGSSQDASEELLKQLQRVSVASNATVIAVLVVFTDGFQAGNFPRVNNSGLDAVGALSRLAATKYPGVRLVSYNIMMVGVSSTVWRDHPDFVSFDRYGTPVVDTPGERLSLDLASANAREYYRSNILATLSAMNASGVYLDFGVLAYGTPNWRAARVATSFDYLQFEESISTGIQTWGLPRRGVLVANSPGNLLADANFNELGPGVWTNPKAVSMSLQEGKRFTPPGAMPSHIYCYDKRLFVAFGAAIGSAPAFRPDSATQFDDFVGTIAPFVRVAMALRDAVPVPPRIRSVPNETSLGAEVVASQTAWGGVVTAIFTARPAAGVTAPCPGTVVIDASWLPVGQLTLHELAMRDPGATCGGREQVTLPAAFQLLPPPAAKILANTPARSTEPVGASSIDNSSTERNSRTIQWNVSCTLPGVSSFATMLVVESVASGAREFIETAAGSMASDDQ